MAVDADLKGSEGTWFGFMSDFWICFRVVVEVRMAEWLWVANFGGMNTCLLDVYM